MSPLLHDGTCTERDGLHSISESGFLIVRNNWSIWEHYAAHYGNGPIVLLHSECVWDVMVSNCQRGLEFGMHFSVSIVSRTLNRYAFSLMDCLPILYWMPILSSVFWSNFQLVYFRASLWPRAFGPASPPSHTFHKLLYFILKKLPLLLITPAAY